MISFRLQRVSNKSREISIAGLSRCRPLSARRFAGEDCRGHCRIRETQRSEFISPSAKGLGSSRSGQEGLNYLVPRQIRCAWNKTSTGDVLLTTLANVGYRIYAPESRTHARRRQRDLKPLPRSHELGTSPAPVPAPPSSAFDLGLLFLLRCPGFSLGGAPEIVASDPDGCSAF